METKRMLLAVALSMAVLFAFQYFAPKRPVPPKAAEQAAPGAVAPAAAAAGGGAAPAVGEAVAPTPAVVPVTRATVANELLSLDLSSRGGAIVGARLLGYRDRAGKGGSPVAVLGQSGDLAGEVTLPAVGLGAGADFRELERTAARVVYGWDSPGGVHVEKTYALEPGRYDVTVTVRVRNGSPAALKDRPTVRLARDYGAGEDKYTFTGPTYLLGDKLEQAKLKDLKKEAKQGSGEIPWVALLEKYFLVAALPTRATGNAVRASVASGQDKLASVELTGAEVDLPPGGEASLGYRLYVGPKATEALAPLGANLTRVIDYGWFGAIARPLLSFLKLLYGFLGNYGLAIIALTTLVKAVFWPLSAKSFQSMQKMKELQPKMQKLKERYSDDKNRLNMEVMQLYKTHKVNPLGGCLPMLVQIPVFFALYRVLLNSIELRHAPFFLWITDLSAKDPFYVTPLIMGASMFLQQKLTPATGVDPVQAKMMLYGMPVLFTFMFLNFPSGLVLYWLVNNVLSIAQQGMMIRRAKASAA